MKKEDVLLRVPKIHYFRTRYREMSIPMALSSEILIDEDVGVKRVCKNYLISYIVP